MEMEKEKMQGGGCKDITERKCDGDGGREDGRGILEMSAGGMGRKIWEREVEGEGCWGCE